MLFQIIFALNSHTYNGLNAPRIFLDTYDPVRPLIYCYVCERF